MSDDETRGFWSGVGVATFFGTAILHGLGVPFGYLDFVFGAVLLYSIYRSQR